MWAYVAPWGGSTGPLSGHARTFAISAIAQVRLIARHSATARSNRAGDVRKGQLGRAG